MSSLNSLKEYSYWWDSVPPAAAVGQAHQLGNGSIDVAIVGAGYSRLSAARMLGRAGAVVAVLERERIGWGASSRNAGQVLTGLRVDPTTLVGRYGPARAKVLFATSIAAIDALEALVADEQLECDY